MVSINDDPVITAYRLCSSKSNPFGETCDYCHVVCGIDSNQLRDAVGKMAGKDKMQRVRAKLRFDFDGLDQAKLRSKHNESKLADSCVKNYTLCEVALDSSSIE